jgi:hypothetical protein
MPHMHRVAEFAEKKTSESAKSDFDVPKNRRAPPGPLRGPSGARRVFLQHRSTYGHKFPNMTLCMTKPLCPSWLYPSPSPTYLNVGFHSTRNASEENSGRLKLNLPTPMHVWFHLVCRVEPARYLARISACRQAFLKPAFSKLFHSKVRGSEGCMHRNFLKH